MFFLWPGWLPGVCYHQNQTEAWGKIPKKMRYLLSFSKESCSIKQAMLNEKSNKITNDM